MADKKIQTNEVIDIDELAMVNRHQQPRFLEEVRCSEDGTVKAYVLKKNPNFHKSQLNQKHFKEINESSNKDLLLDER